MYTYCLQYMCSKFWIVVAKTYNSVCLLFSVYVMEILVVAICVLDCCCFEFSAVCLLLVVFMQEFKKLDID